jgi:hypothetical protein
MLGAMSRWIRRLVLLVLIAAGVAAVVRTFGIRKVRSDSLGPPHHWPPFEPPTESVTAKAAEPVPSSDAEPAPEPAVTDTPAWVAPVEGACPAGYPIKAKTKSRIYHVLDGQSYERTVPERCYATAEAAEQDGYRRAKA